MLRRALGGSRAYGECARRSIHTHSRSKTMLRRALSSSTNNGTPVTKEGDDPVAAFAKFLFKHTRGYQYVASSDIWGAGVGLVASPQSNGFRAHATALELPSSFWGPFSAATAMENAKKENPQFYDALVKIDAERGGGKGKLVDIVALATNLYWAFPELGLVGKGYQSILESGYRNSPSHPLLWGPEIQNRYQGSPFLEQLTKRQTFFTEVHQSLFDPAQVNPFIFKWCISCVLSRAVAAKDRRLTFLPYFDFMNHTWSPNVGYVVKEDGLVVVRALKEIRRGEELRFCYNNTMDNHKMLYTYGFVDPKNPNPLTQRVHLSTLRSDSGPMWVIGGRTSKEEAQNFELAWAMAISGGKVNDLAAAQDIIDDASLEKRKIALDDMRHYLQHYMRQYVSSLADDQAALLQAETEAEEGQKAFAKAGKVPFNHDLAVRRTAVSLLIEEKKQQNQAMKSIEYHQGTPRPIRRRAARKQKN